MVGDHETESNEDEEERPVFRPYTRESLIQSEARIAEEEAKRNERKKKAEESEVTLKFEFSHYNINTWFKCLIIDIDSLKRRN